MHSTYYVVAFIIWLLLLLSVSSGLEAKEDETDVNKRCEPISVEVCKSLGYNMTSVPNFIGMYSQRDVHFRLQSFRPLVQYGCSSQLQFFLCSMYVPMCTPQVSVFIGPCKPLCENVRKRCAPVLLGLGLSWPAELNCSSLPLENNEKNMCMEGPPETIPLPPSSTRTNPRPRPPPELLECGHFAHPQFYRYVNVTSRCAPLCYAHVSFSPSDKVFALVWVAIWSVVTFIMCLFTALSLVIDPTVFKYPERALVHMCVCYGAVALGYLVRLSAGASAISCIHSDSQLPLAVTEGSLQPSCALVFLLLYYFSIAAAVWWLMLCVSWLLRAWRHCSHDQLMRKSCLYHILAWGLPALLAIACLLLRKVAAEELTGTCQIGAGDTMVRWLLVPQFTILVSGSTLVFVVFACLWRSRCSLVTEGVPTHRIDVAAARLGIVSIIYMVPTTCLIGSLFYEYVEEPRWLQDKSVRPNMQIFMLKQFMTLVPGIFGSLFLANSRVLASWKRLFIRLTSSKSMHNSSQMKTTKSSAKTYNTSVKLPEDRPLKSSSSGKKHKKTSTAHDQSHHHHHHQHLMTPIVMGTQYDYYNDNHHHQHSHYHHYSSDLHHHLPQCHTNHQNQQLTGSETTV